jgi:glucose/arabinose dehydrogenase
MRKWARISGLIGIIASVLSPSLGAQQGQLTAVANDGTVYVTQRRPGNLVMLRDTDGDGIADVQKIVVRQRQLHGIAIRDREIFLVDIKAVYAGDILADGRIGQRRIITAGLPDGGQHPHPYHFQIFALDTELDRPDGGHVMAEGELVGTFQAPEQPPQ